MVAGVTTIAASRGLSTLAGAFKLADYRTTRYGRVSSLIRSIAYVLVRFFAVSGHTRAYYYLGGWRGTNRSSWTLPLLPECGSRSCPFPLPPSPVAAVAPYLFRALNAPGKKSHVHDSCFSRVTNPSWACHVIAYRLTPANVYFVLALALSCIYVSTSWRTIHIHVLSCSCLTM